MLDIGRIKLNSIANFVYRYEDTLSVIVGDTALEVEGTEFISETFFNSETEEGGTVSNPTRIKLPLGVAVQFEAKLMEDVYFATNFVYGFERGQENYGPKRPTVLAFTTRLEKEKFEIAMPISIYEWRQVNLGLSMRFGGFYIGTDMLSSYLFKQDVYGMDLFLGFKLRIKEHKTCHQKIKRVERKSFVGTSDMKKDFRVNHAKD